MRCHVAILLVVVAFLYVLFCFYLFGDILNIVRERYSD